MSAKELLDLVADDDGLDLEKGVQALQAGIQRLLDEGVTLRGEAALYLFSKQIDHMTSLFSETIVSMQAAIVNLQQGMQLLLTGQQPTIADYETAAELEALLLGFEIESLANTYDALLIQKEGADADNPTEAGDDQRTTDPDSQGGTREVPAETLAEGEGADPQE